MLITKITTLCRTGNRIGSIICSNGFHSSSSNYLDQTWREQKKLPRNPNSFNQLVNDPDYTFKDGRCTPYGMRYMRRIQQQREYTERIVKLVREVDYAVERHARLQKETKAKKEQILSSKLKPKGKLFKPLHKA